MADKGNFKGNLSNPPENRVFRQIRARRHGREQEEVRMDVTSILKMKGADVLTIVPDATVAEACTVLRDNYIGAVVVVDADGGIAGILSERDVAVALPNIGGDLGATPVSEIMTADVITCTPDITVQGVLDIMVANGIRHLPVEDGGRLVGVVSLRDMVANWFGAIPGADMAPLEAASA
jgi:CBS domain-containing protein